MIICDKKHAETLEGLRKVGKRGYIYVLECPDSGEVRYIGQTNNLKVRYSSHVSKAHLCDTPKRRWVHSLREDGKRPVMRVIDVFGWHRYRGHSESDWIKEYLQSGARLLNCDHLHQGIARQCGIEWGDES